jgi:cell wall-associated NlpC family hydrolase
MGRGRSSTNHSQPRGLNRRRVGRLLSEIRHERGAAGRIEALSRRFVGRPYRANPLIGSAGTPEVFTASLDGFDCVTYIETVVALARASNAEDFTRWLRKMRYDQGRIQWERRNHYMTGWIRNNVRNRILGPLSARGIPTVNRDRILDAVPGLAALRTRIRCVPKPAVARLQPRLRSGDLIFFVSTRGNLDVFHAGIIVRDGKTTLMRHASRGQGSVVEQELGSFLRTNRMAGVIVVRPREIARRRAADA